MESDFLKNITTVHKITVNQFGNVYNLVLLIRNSSYHYYEYPKNIQKILRTLPKKFVYKFSKKFPSLLMVLNTVIETHCKAKERFKIYLTTRDI